MTQINTRCVQPKETVKVCDTSFRNVGSALLKAQIVCPYGSFTSERVNMCPPLASVQVGMHKIIKRCSRICQYTRKTTMPIPVSSAGTGLTAPSKSTTLTFINYAKADISTIVEKQIPLPPSIPSTEHFTHLRSN